MNGHKVGYIRVSSVDQNISRQLEGIQLDKIFIDKCSGKDTNRDQYKEMMSYLRSGDHLLVHSIDRLCRNLPDLRNVINDLVKKQVKVEFVKENLVFSGEDSPMSVLTLSILGAFAEFERSLIRERQREGIEIAKKKGLLKGKPKSLKESQIQEMKDRVAKGESKASIARYFNMSQASIYNYLKNERKKNEIKTS